MLAGYWGLFAAFPGPEGPWSKVGNIGALIDLKVLGYNYSGYYTTINALGNALTVLFGVWTGMLISSGRTHAEKMKILLGCAAGAFALGLALAPWIPMVKRLWLGSFTFFSAGWVLLRCDVDWLLRPGIGTRCRSDGGAARLEAAWFVTESTLQG
jgi:predicted acyltransferase